MADFSNIIQEINADINTNGSRQITGAKLNAVLRDMIAAVNAAKQDPLTIDATPTEDSTNPVQSGGVYSALLGKATRFYTPDITDIPPTILNRLKVGDIVSYGNDATTSATVAVIDVQNAIIILVYNDGINVVGFQYQNGICTDTVSFSLSGMAKKVSGATNGHLAGLDTNGNLTDSGIAAEDVATTADLAAKPITYSALKALRDGGNLVPSAWYRITDYVCKTAQANTRNAGHVFDILVTADSETELNENARAAHHDGDTYFEDCKLEAWELKYCLDNDVNRFVWVDPYVGKGVIYYMKDEWNNEAPFDFKNILFTRNTTWFNQNQTWATNVLGSVPSTNMNFYFLSWVNQNNEVQDLSIVGQTISTGGSGRYIGVYDNKIGETSAYSMGFYVGTSACISLPCTIFVNSYQSGAFNGCFGNILRNNCFNNSFGSCNSISLDDSCQNNTFGNYCNNITVFDGVQYCNVTGGTSSAPVKNAQILNGTKGASDSNKLTITFTANQNYTQVAAKDENGVLKIWSAADKQDTISDLSTIRSGAALGATSIQSSEKGVASGVATLDIGGKVPQSQLPSYVDDVLEYANLASFPATGESGKIYVALDTNKTYRWSGSAYVEIAQGLALGETSSTAFAGDRGKAIEDKIPSSASSSNKLATASDVNGKLSAPSTAGTSGQVLTSDGQGGQSWQTPQSGGTATDVQVNGTSITSNDVANIITEGTYNASTNKIATMSDLPSVSGKADKVSGATNGNLAALDSNGNLTDSGYDASDFATAAQGAKADTIYGNYLKAGESSGSSSVEDFDPFAETVHNIPQVLSNTQKQQARQNIDAVSGADLKTLNGQSLVGSGNIDIERYFKGWYTSSSALPANPVVGDYAYVKGAESTDPAAIYECTTAGSWSDSGRTADTSNVQTFASSQEVNEVHIVNDLTTGGVDDVLSAEQGKTLFGFVGKTIKKENIVPQYTEGYLVKQNGELQQLSGYAYFAPIRLDYLEKIELNYGSPLYQGGGVAIVYKCDAQGTFIEPIVVGHYNTDAVAFTNETNGTVYIGVSCYAANLKYTKTSYFEVETKEKVEQLDEKTENGIIVQDLFSSVETTFQLHKYPIYSSGNITTSGDTNPVGYYVIPYNILKDCYSIRAYLMNDAAVGAAIAFYDSESTYNSDTYLGGVCASNTNLERLWFEAKVLDDAKTCLVCDRPLGDNAELIKIVGVKKDGAIITNILKLNDTIVGGFEETLLGSANTGTGTTGSLSLQETLYAGEIIKVVNNIPSTSVVHIGSGRYESDICKGLTNGTYYIVLPCETSILWIYQVTSGSLSEQNVVFYKVTNSLSQPWRTAPTTNSTYRYGYELEGWRIGYQWSGNSFDFSPNTGYACIKVDAICPHLTIEVADAENYEFYISVSSMGGKIITATSFLTQFDDYIQCSDYFTLSLHKKTGVFTEEDLDAFTISIKPYIQPYATTNEVKELGERLMSPLSTVNTALNIKKPYLYHFEPNSFIKDADNHNVIPSQSAFDIEIAARLGFEYIEGNVQATSDGKYIVMHGEAGKFGSTVYSLDSTDISNVAINSKTFDWIKTNVRFNSYYDKYKVAPLSLDEFCSECKKHSIGVLVGPSPSNDAINICLKHLGTEGTILYNPTTSQRTLFKGVVCIWNNSSSTTPTEIIQTCESHGLPVMYGLGPSLLEALVQNEQLYDLIEEAHAKGFWLESTAVYDSEDNVLAAFEKGVDYSASGWQVNDFEPNNFVYDLYDVSQFTGTGTITNGVASLSNGETLSCGSNDVISLGKGMLSIRFSGTLTISFGSRGNRSITSDGSRDIVISDYFFRRNTKLTITASSNTTIINLVYKTSRC